MSNSKTHAVDELATQYLLRSGEAIRDDKDRGPMLHAGHFRLGCTPYLPDAPERSTNWSDLKARGAPIPGPGQILFDCALQHDGGIVQRPTVITNDGNLAVIEASEPGGPTLYRLEVTATASADKIALPSSSALRP